MVERYETIRESLTHEIEISRSRFIADLAPVSSEEQARDYIASIKGIHPKARHHCTAFVIGPSSEIKRSNDDGEPSGTAGAPMLEALLAAGISDVVAVVTRYFGGVLLGAGGLTRAYRASVAGAVEKAVRQERVMQLAVAVTSGYEISAAVENFARRSGHPILDAQYGEDVTLTIGVPPAQFQEIEKNIMDVSSGSAAIKKLDSRFVP